MSPVVATAKVQVHNDDLLMSQVKDRNLDAFEELYERYSHRAYRVARALCHDPGHAENAIEEAFLFVWRNRTAYQPQRSTIAAWLLTTVLDRAVKHPSRRAAENALTANPTPQVLSKQTANSDEGHRLWALLARLPSTQREVIALAFCGELTHTEIAAALDLPASTVKNLMRSGLQALRTNIEKDAA